MVRVFIKGGVWKNSEDEILKAAVMKYGKQQWARVASLLNRKSAKQCKARWHEWLDPSVKKIEWSREEEEKLLHLAKLLPNQWRTIGPLVGRTAAQCQERYEGLLDEAALASSGGAPGAEEEGEEGAASALRRHTLRPGEIDTHPETKPARPDPIDMDEDEIEMLQEARARLANTQGKKAKRKQREKMLAEAKRLAELQKRRELKAAGLLSGNMRRRARRGKRGRREIDYGVEIPFHKPAPAGFHSVAAENEKSDEILANRLKDVNYKKLNEAQYRTRDREAALAKKKQDARLKSLEKANAVLAAAVSKRNEESSIQRRGVLSLPQPTLTDQELAQVAKSNNNAASLPSATGPTDALLADYTDRPLPTPMRTPASQPLATRQNILEAASNLRDIQSSATPLLAATTALPDTDADVSSATPMQRQQISATPSQSTQMDDASLASSFYTTPSLSTKELARQQRQAAKKARFELEQALASLPAPQFEYELAAPTLPTEEDDKPSQPVVLDAADIEKQRLQELQRQAAELYEKQSTVLKREDLPRPTSSTDKVHSTILDQLSQPEIVLWNEMLTLIAHDTLNHPVVPGPDDLGTNTAKTKRSKAKKRNRDDTATDIDATLEYIPEDELQNAKLLLQNETENFAPDSDHIRTSTENASSMLFLPERGWQSNDTKADRIASLRLQYRTLSSSLSHLDKKSNKLRSKLQILHKGYTQRCQTLQNSLEDVYREGQRTDIEKSVYEKLERQESGAIPRRMDALEEEIEELERRERKRQKYYGDLLHERARCLKRMK